MALHGGLTHVELHRQVQGLNKSGYFSTALHLDNGDVTTMVSIAIMVNSIGIFEDRATVGQGGTELSVAARFIGIYGA
ncbi:MAG: hypothetical protein ACR2OU_07165 [Thermomicrobiales bacterium]